MALLFAVVTGTLRPRPGSDCNSVWSRGHTPDGALEWSGQRL